MSKFRYPVDTDQFQEIREQGMLYVDKMDMMYELANKYKYLFLARPRRFGKSLLCNTFKAYFLGQKELFEACPEHEFMVSSSNQRGLKVMELEKEWMAKKKREACPEQGRYRSEEHPRQGRCRD